MVALASGALAAGLMLSGANAGDETAKAVLHNRTGQEIGVVMFIQQGNTVL